MTDRDECGQAYSPTFGELQCDVGWGMSLRDWFAGQVDGIDQDANSNFAMYFNADPKPPKDDCLEWAKWFAKADATLRYIRADAMVAARDERP